MKFLFLMDPYSTLNLETETSLTLMTELLQRREEVYWCEMTDLALQGAQLVLDSRPVLTVQPFALGPVERLPPEVFAALLIRKDQPFDLTYFHLTLLLEHLPAAVLQVNPAPALRRLNEKLYGLHWPEFVPPTLTSANQGHLEEFLQAQGEIVVKPLDDCSGRGIQRLHAQDPEAKAKLQAMLLPDGKPRFVTAQAFLPAVAAGDKRVYLVNGQVLGVVNRIPKEGSFLGNIHQGAICAASSLTLREQLIVETLGPELRREGLFLVGLDLIGERITEINLTSPSALRQINQVTGLKLEVELVNQLLQRVKEHRIQAGGLVGTA